MSFKKHFLLNSIITSLTVCIVTVNCLFVIVNVLSKLQNKVPYYPPGYEFVDFRNKLMGEKVIGYLTNRDMSAEKNDQEYLLAQYALAPVIVELNNPNHKLLILDYTDPVFAVYKLKELKAIHIYDNKFNKILAIRRP